MQYLLRQCVTILASFIAIIGVLVNLMNTRLIRIEDKQDALLISINDKFDRQNESLFLIKAKLGIIQVADKPEITPPETKPEES